MLRKIFLGLLIILNCSGKLSSQNLSSCTDSSILKSCLNLLYDHQKSIGNDPYILIKIEFVDTSLFAVISKGQFENYLVSKYKVDTKLASAKSKEMLERKVKIPIADTSYFYIKGVQYLYPMSVLNKFRKIPFKNFLNRYVTRPGGLNAILIGYLFEKGILYEPLGIESISYFSYTVLTDCYGVVWDYQKEIWVNNK